MVKPASISRFSGPLACLALLLSSLPTIAQEAKKPAGGKEQSEEAIFIPIEYRPPPYQLSVGVRVSGRAKVKFSGLGSIPFNSTPGTDTTSKVARTYDNGYVDLAITVDENTGVRIPTTNNQTNVWSFNSASQLDNVEFPNARSVAFQSNRIESTGATAEAENGSSTTWDMEISRQIGGGRKLTWGVLFGASLSDINAKYSGSVKANLHTQTDRYAVDGTDTRLLDPTSTTPAYGPYTAVGPQSYNPTHPVVDADGHPVLDSTTNLPTYAVDLDANGNRVVKWYDPNLGLGDLPFSRSDSVTEGVDVTGTWQVKGAFMTARFGPYVAYQLGRHFAIRASAGLTFTVLGAQMRFAEQYFIPSLNLYLKNEATVHTTDATVTGTLGYFVSGEIDWFMTRRTGLFFGATHESFARDLRLQIGSQTAEIATSAGTAFRTGITTRF